MITFQDIRLVARAKYLLFVPSPFRLIDAVDPVLHFHDNAAIRLHDSRVVGAVEEALCLFEGHRAYGC